MTTTTTRSMGWTAWDPHAHTSAFHPLHRLGRQAVKRLNGLRDMLFLCVLDFVVADSSQGLDEQHHRRYPGPGNLGGVVQWSGWHSMRHPRDFLDGQLS